jgi:hypothetical protein
MIAMGVISAIEKAVTGGSNNRIFLGFMMPTLGLSFGHLKLALPLAGTVLESRRSTLAELGVRTRRTPRTGGGP